MGSTHGPKLVIDTGDNGFFIFTDDNNTIEGELIKITTYQKHFLSRKLNRYYIMTVVGERNFFLGSAADKRLKGILVPGRSYRFVYMGKVGIKGGRKMNRYSIYESGSYKQSRGSNKEEYSPTKKIRKVKNGEQSKGSDKKEG